MQAARTDENIEYDPHFRQRTPKLSEKTTKLPETGKKTVSLLARTRTIINNFASLPQAPHSEPL